MAVTSALVSTPLSGERIAVAAISLLESKKELFRVNLTEVRLRVHITGAS